MQQVKKKYDALSQETAALKIQCIARGINARKVSKFRLVDKHRARARLMGVTAEASTGPQTIVPPPASTAAVSNRKGSAGVVNEEIGGIAMVPATSTPVAMEGENVNPNEQSEAAPVDESVALIEQPSLKASSSQRGNPFATTALDAPVEEGSSELQCNVPDGCLPGMLVVIGEGLDNEEQRLIVGFASILVDQPLSHAHPIGTSITIYNKSSDKPALTASLSEPPLPGTEVEQPGEAVVVEVNDPTATTTDPEAEVEINADATSAVDVAVDDTSKAVEGEDAAGGGGVVRTDVEGDEETKDTLEPPQSDSSPSAPTSDPEQPPPPSDDVATITATVTDEPIDIAAVADESLATSNEDPDVLGSAVETTITSLPKAASFSAPKKGVSDAAAANKRKHGSVANIPQVRVVLYSPPPYEVTLILTLPTATNHSPRFSN